MSHAEQRIIWELRYAMLVRGISQAAMARACGVSAKHMNLVLNWKASPSIRLLAMMGYLCGFKIELSAKVSSGLDGAG